MKLRKICFSFIEGLKNEPVLDINELKSMGWVDKIKLGEKLYSWNVLKIRMVKY